MLWGDLYEEWHILFEISLEKLCSDKCLASTGMFVSDIDMGLRTVDWTGNVGLHLRFKFISISVIRLLRLIFSQPIRKRLIIVILPVSVRLTTFAVNGW